MPYNSNSKSYLILYLVIILVLLYAITFMSSYTCNISVEPKEGFESSNAPGTSASIKGINDMLPGTLSSPPLTPNDFSLLGVGKNHDLYIQDVIGGQWSPQSTLVNKSGSVVDICVSPTGTIYGLGTPNQKLFSRENLNASWVEFTSVSGQWKGVSLMNDGIILLLVGMDSNLYTYNAFTQVQTTQLIKPQLVANKCCVCKVIQLQNNTFLAIGGGGCDTLYTANTLNDNWTQVSVSGVGITSIAQAPNGQILGLKADGFVYTKGNDWNTWNKTASGGFIAIATYPLPPQNISGYSRMGAFVDGKGLLPRAIPNMIGHYNTLPECIIAAQSKGYNTVGYQASNYCFGGNDSPYDKYGFQTDSTKSVSAYPGGLTNIVYKTVQGLVSTNDPADGEVYIYPSCQFIGSGNKMTIGQYPNISNATTAQSIKLGPNTKLTLYPQPNFQGEGRIYLGNSDVVNKDNSCIQITFSSAKVEKNPDAMPSKPSELTNAQLTSLWKSVGCTENSIGFTPSAITRWKSLNKLSDVIVDMMKYKQSTSEEYKQECNTVASQPNVPGEGEVVLYENCNYTGRYKKFGMGNVAFVGSDFNDLTSSIKIGPYTSLTVYADMNFGGKSMSWKNDSNVISLISCLISNNFNDMLSSLKVSSSAAQVTNSLSPQASPVYTLGPYNMAPWNLSSFADITAKWIWWNQWCGGPKGISCNGSAPVDANPVRFQLIADVSGNRDIPVVIHVIADNAPQGANFVKLNDKLIGQIMDSGWATPNYTQITSSLAPGNNLLEFDVQNVGGGAGLLVSVINSNTGQVIANSGNGQWGWVDPNKVMSSTMTTENNSLVIRDEAAIGKIVSFKNLNEIHQMTVGGTFRLTVNLKSVPPYVKGQQYKEGETNQFYLSIEKLDPNCQVSNGSQCMNIYVDNKKCDNATLSNVSKVNAYRLVLVSKAYVLDPNIPFGKNVDFTVIKVGEKYYIKNIQTGYMPKLFLNDFKQQLYGYMDQNYLSNISSIKSNTNKLCGANTVPPVETTPETKTIGTAFTKAWSGLFGTQQTGPRPDQKFVNCSVNADGSMYMMTTTNLVESNPVKFVLNKDGTVNIRLQSYNSYGNIDKSYSLIFCNFNVNTYAFIEKLTNPLGTFLINMVCFDPDDKRQLPNNTLNFNFEISKYPDSYLREKNIYNLNT